MLDSPKAGQQVWFRHGADILSGIVISEKTIDGFYSVSVLVGIPKLLLPEELYVKEEDVLCNI